MSKSRNLLTSLIPVEERLREAIYFARTLRRQRNIDVVHYQLNAFLAAARSVTFILQKQMARVNGFDCWWCERQGELSRDDAARFFLKLRNFSQKEGKVSLVGTRELGHHRSRWIFRFGGNTDRVPARPIHRNIDECCVEHVAKLAALILKCCDQFPYHTSIRRALTVDGVSELALSIHDICLAAGLPREWGDASCGLPQEEVLRILRESVDDLDFQFLKRLAHPKPKVRSKNSGPMSLGEDLLRKIVVQLEDPNRTHDGPEVFCQLILEMQDERSRK